MNLPARAVVPPDEAAGGVTFRIRLVIEVRFVVEIRMFEVTAAAAPSSAENRIGWLT